jgi:hypothetical protein
MRLKTGLEKCILHFFACIEKVVSVSLRAALNNFILRVQNRISVRTEMSEMRVSEIS